MKKEQNLEELSKSIVKVYDEESFEILYTKAEVKPYLSKYSSSHTPTLKLYLDGKVISQPGKVMVEYKCNCGRYEKILLCRFLTKQTPIHCKRCRETEEKRAWHSECLKMNHKGIQYKHRTEDLTRKYDFENESEDFKNEYFKKNLTMDEFETVKKYVYSVKGIQVEGKTFELLPHENGVNHKKYRQMVLINGEKFPFKEIKLKCPMCGSIFSISRQIKERVLKHNFDCKGCYLNNKTFSIKKYDEGLTYQGKTELKFIEKCKEMGVKITNGPIIKYLFENEKHDYRVDFELPDLKMVVEIKDNHIWHRKQVESGKWGAKEKSALDYCEKENKVYKLLFPKDIDKFFKTLERDSLVYREICRS